MTPLFAGFRLCPSCHARHAQAEQAPLPPEPIKIHTVGTPTPEDFERRQLQRADEHSARIRAYQAWLAATCASQHNPPALTSSDPIERLTALAQIWDNDAAELSAVATRWEKGGRTDLVDPALARAMAHRACAAELRTALEPA